MVSIFAIIYSRKESGEEDHDDKFVAMDEMSTPKEEWLESH